MKQALLIPLLAFFVGNASAQTADEKIAALEARVAKLEALVAKLTAGKATPPAPAAKEPAAKGNKYGIPDAVLAKIKADVEREWPDDFSMQKVLIEHQVKSYKDLQEK